MKAPKIGYQDGGKTKKPLDYSKSKEVSKTREQLLSEGYKESVKDGKAYFYKEKESSVPKTNTPPHNYPVTPKKSSAIGTGNKPKPHSTPPTNLPPKEDYSQEIVHLSTSPTPKAVGLNTDVSARTEEKRNALGTNLYTISYSDLKGGGGMSKATTEIFNNDPSKGGIGAHISGFDANGNPIFSGKTQADFSPTKLGQTAIMSNDVNKNSLDYQLSNSKNPVETTGNKFQENTAQGLNAQGFDKSSQGINVGLQDINTLPTTELKKRDASVPITSPNFNKGGKIKAPMGIKGYKNGDVVTPNVPLDVNGNPITSGTNTLNPGGTEFKTEGDYQSSGNTNGNSNYQTANQTEQQKKGGGMSTLGSKLGSSMGWLTYANAAQQMVRGNVKKDTVVDPHTGATITKAETDSGAIVENTATPYHEQIQKDWKNKDYAHIGSILGGPGMEIAYNALIGKNRNDIRYANAKNEITRQEDVKNNMAARDAGQTGFTSNSDIVATPKENKFNAFTHKIGLAEGGKVVGKGTGKSDDIDAKVKGFVVPEENKEIAEVIRKVVLKKAPSMKANLNQKNGIKVKLSNGEHLFTPAEEEKIENAGINLHALAPNAKDEDVASGNNHFVDGGKVPEGTKLGQYYYRNGKWTNGTGNILSKEGAKQYEDAYFKTIAQRKKAENDAYARDIEESNRANNPNYKLPTKSGDQLNKLVDTKPSTISKTPKAPKTSGVTNENYVSPQDVALAETFKAPKTDPNLEKYNKDLADAEKNTTKGADYNQEVYNRDLADANKRASESEKGKGWNAWNTVFGKGNGLETIASVAQIGLGLNNLNKAGARPVGQIDPTFQANVDRAQAQSNYGFSAEQNALINQQNQNATNLARFAARNYAGGNAGNAFNMERSAINEGWGRGLQAKIANQNLMLDKQQVANNLSLQKAAMSRQLFEDKLNGWNQNQTAGSALLGSGIRNIIGANRYANTLNSINEQNQLGQ